MADVPPQSGLAGAVSDDIGTAPGAESTTGAPRWVKAFGVMALVVVVLVVVVLLVGGGTMAPVVIQEPRRSRRPRAAS